MYAPAVQFEAYRGVCDRGHEFLDQQEFEEVLSRKRAIRNGLKLARRYRRFYRRYCVLTNLQHTVEKAAYRCKENVPLYEGNDPYKVLIMFRWLRATQDQHQLDVIWYTGFVGVGWKI